MTPPACRAFDLRPDPHPQRNYFIRSDDYSFVKQGIPAAQILRGSFLLGLSIAQRADRPVWNAHSLFRRFPEKEPR